MPRRHPPIPRIWLMTDERMGDALWDALERLPRGSGVVFRHYTLEPAKRLALFRRIARIARRRKFLLLRAGSRPMPGEDGVHGTRGKGLVSWAVHNRAEAVLAARTGARVAFVSPIFPTGSHPDARTLGRKRAGLLIRGLKMPAIALGGMDTKHSQSLKGLGFHGWAGIDAWLDD